MDGALDPRRTGLLWLACICLAAAIGLQYARDRYLSAPIGSDNLLYVESPSAMKRLALGYDALLADVYWIRAVQYFGGQRLAERARHKHDLVYPLLDITTTLDPYFNIAYRFGSVFVAEGAPNPGRPDLAVKLLEKGANPNVVDLAGMGALYAAVDMNSMQWIQGHPQPILTDSIDGTELVRILLQKGADPNAADSTGKTAIVYAVARGFTGIAERLLTAGVDVNGRYGNGLTALMWAAGHANDVPDGDGVKTTELLLARGARLDEVDDRGRSALMMAAELGHGEIVKLLLARGAMADLKDKEGKSAADLAEPAVRSVLPQR